MKFPILITLNVALVLTTFKTHAQFFNKMPHWVNGKEAWPKTKPYCCYIREAGRDADSTVAYNKAVAKARTSLAQFYEISVRVGENIKTKMLDSAFIIKYSSEHNIDVSMISGTVLKNTQVVDKTYRYNNGIYTYWVLMPSDSCQPTTKYGIKPVFLSIFPGLGQLFIKHQYRSGGLLLGTFIVSGGLALVCDDISKKAYKEANKYRNINKTREENYKKYSNAAKCRNVSIGIGAVLVVTSVIDAAFSKGEIQLATNMPKQLEIKPYWAFNQIGASMIWHLN
ncbi:MAG: hypothetical protein U0X91_27850 [Spirosomataceae bacterium]